MAFDRLAALLGKGNLSLMPSPARSALVQSLMAQSMNQPNMARTPIEGLAIASKPILAAILAKREERGRQNMDRRREALSGALGRATQPGPEGEAARISALIQAGGLPNDPLAQSIIGSQAQAVFGGGESPKAVTAMGKINEDERNGNISSETANSLRLAATNKDALSIGQAESDLRAEFQKNVSGISNGLSSLENARNLLRLENNPVGAQSALTAFVRAIDNSVVRPSEQAMYQNIFGVAQGLQNRIGLLLGEGAFNEQSKKEIGDAIEALAKNAESLRDDAVSYYNELATDSGLKPYHVTGFDFSPKRSSTPETAPRSTPKPSQDELGDPILRIP